MTEPILIEVEYVGNYSIRVSFADGKTGIVDLSSLLWGPVFEPLKDFSYFQIIKL